MSPCDLLQTLSVNLFRKPRPLSKPTNQLWNGGISLMAPEENFRYNRPIIATEL
jgi:hypothetical protein